jgi:glycosyltransferase involved in cell wall biosynthesis
MTIHPPLLSIIIPTRNRIPFCISAIESILIISDPRLELVVQDNSDTNKLEEYVRNRKSDNRLKYRYTTAAFSTIDNFNAGMELSTGEYVCFIGDDDGINPEIIEAAAWAKEKNIDALSWYIKASYLWPGTIMPSTFFTKTEGGKLTVHPFFGKIRKTNAELEIKKFLLSGGANYMKFKLPKAYHGLVNRFCFEKVKIKTGNYFGGLSPDIFSSLAIALVAKCTYVIDYPLSIAGSCPIAEQTHNSKDANLKPLEDAPHLRNRGKYIWNELIPTIYTGDTIQLETGLASLNLMKRSDLIINLNTTRMAAFLIISYPQLKNKIIDHTLALLKSQYKSRILGQLKIRYNYLKFFMKMLFEKGSNRILLMIGIRNIYNIKNQATIFSASIALIEHLKNKNQNLTNYL